MDSSRTLFVSENAVAGPPLVACAATKVIKDHIEAKKDWDFLDLDEILMRSQMIVNREWLGRQLRKKGTFKTKMEEI